MSEGRKRYSRRTAAIVSFSGVALVFLLGPLLGERLWWVSSLVAVSVLVLILYLAAHIETGNAGDHEPGTDDE